MLHRVPFCLLGYECADGNFVDVNLHNMMLRLYSSSCDGMQKAVVVVCTVLARNRKLEILTDLKKNIGNSTDYF